MPKGTPNIDARINELKRTTGQDFAMRVATDMILLPKDEREKALRMLGAINDTVSREVEAATTK